MAELTLDSSVQYLRGVGPKRREEFNKVGVHTVRDLLQYYPRDYIFAVHRKVYEVKEGETVVVSGDITRKGINPNNGAVTVQVSDDSGSLTCIWFNQPFVATIFAKRKQATVWGKVTEYKGVKQIVNAKYSFTSASAPKPDGSGTPIYPATKGLPTGAIENAVKAALEFVNQWYIHDHTWDGFLHERGFLRINEAVRYIHQPCDKACLRLAKRRLKYEEFYRLQQRMKNQRDEQAGYESTPLRWGTEIHKRIELALNVTPTDDQAKVMGEVVRDMCSEGPPMYRLVQGDVGCGKTIVAIYAALLTAVNRKQTVIMCPTKILAQQHFVDLQKVLRSSRFSTCLLTDDTNRQLTREFIAEGTVDIIVATTSVLSDSIRFHDLGLLVVDEEHRFGVRQKDKLVKQHKPHQLYMSATPIPKALAATAFGDLDVSTIRTMPQGRGRRVTSLVFPQHTRWMVDQVDEALEDGSQVYDVYPRIEGEGGIQEAWDSDGDAWIGGITGMIHGKRKQEDNQAILKQFRDGDLNVLMSTSMVEVGVHVPRANVMIIHEAHMFGLSQLHQLRGRIGRCADDSVCYLMCDTEDPAAIERLEFLEKTDDGFDVASKDLELRGPGELLGTKQHGLPELKLADLITDYSLLVMAKEDVNGLR